MYKKKEIISGPKASSKPKVVPTSRDLKSMVAKPRPQAVLPQKKYSSQK